MKSADHGIRKLSRGRGGTYLGLRPSERVAGREDKTPSTSTGESRFVTVWHYSGKLRLALRYHIPCGYRALPWLVGTEY